MGDDPLTLAKGSTPAREITPLGGKGLDPLTLAFPYPRTPALCRKDTTYPWSYRLRSNYTRVMTQVMMLMARVMVRVRETLDDGDGHGGDEGEGDGQRMSGWVCG